MSTLNKGCLVIHASCSPAGRVGIRAQQLGWAGPQGHSDAHMCEGLGLIPRIETYAYVGGCD